MTYWSEAPPPGQNASHRDITGLAMELRWRRNYVDFVTKRCLIGSVIETASGYDSSNDKAEDDD
jgi:hypothetical protein